jgi:hypothetical protein
MSRERFTKVRVIKVLRGDRAKVGDVLTVRSRMLHFHESDQAIHRGLVVVPVVETPPTRWQRFRAGAAALWARVAP